MLDASAAKLLDAIWIIPVNKIEKIEKVFW